MVGQVVSGQGWMVSRTVRTSAGPEGDWEVGWLVEHHPVVGWVLTGPMGLAPMTVRGGMTAMPVKDLADAGTMLWHPDVTSREHVEAELMERAGGGG